MSEPPRRRRVSSVRLRLVQLTAAVAVPLMLLAAVSTWYAYRSELTSQQEGLLRRAQAAANLVDRDLDGAMSVLRVLATSQALATGDLAGFEAELRRTSDDFGGALINLTAPSGIVALSTNWAPGARRENVEASGFALEALRLGHPAVSDLIVGMTTHLPRVGVAFPVFPRDAAPGRAAYPAWLLSLYLPIDRLSQDLASLNLPPSWLATVSDRHYRVVARTRDLAAALGRVAPADLATAMSRQPTGLVGNGHRDPEGTETMSAFARAPISGYYVALGIPQAELDTPIRATLLRVAGIAALLTALGLGGALLLASRIVTALRRVAAAEPGTAPATGLREIDELALAIALAENRRRETADSFRLLAETMPGWVFVTDAEGGNTYVNSAFREQTGQTEEQTRRNGWMDLLPPEDAARVRAAWRRAIDTGQEYHSEYRCRVRDGSYRWFLARARPLRDSAGTVLGWYGVAIDIEDRREAELILQRREAELSALNQELESLVQAEIAARETAQIRAAQAERLQALGQLAGGIAHDFNNILQGVQGAAALVERRAADPGQVAKLARMIIDAAGRGATITRRLLAFSRRDNLQPSAVDPLSLLLAMRDLLQHTVGDGIRISVAAAAGLPALHADKGGLETVLVNLAANGADAMDGNGLLALAAAAELVGEAGGSHLPSGLPPGAYIRLSVSDTGVGMDSATLARASEPFFTTKPVGKGTGLGLAMARGFAEQSGGGLTIESQVGCGTTIHLWLPQSHADAVDSPDASPGAIPAPAAARLLLVDDDPVVRQTLSQQLEDAGYTVLPAASAAYALALLDAGEAIDVIVTDLSMPGMNGAAMLREVHNRRPGLKAVLVTGFANEAASIADNPDISLLHKPVTAETLARHITSLLGVETVAG